MKRDGKILRGVAILMVVFAALIMAIGIQVWFTDGRIVPLAPGLLLLSSALFMLTSKRLRN